MKKKLLSYAALAAMLFVPQITSAQEAEDIVVSPAEGDIGNYPVWFVRLRWDVIPRQR